MEKLCYCYVGVEKVQTQRFLVEEGMCRSSSLAGAEADGREECIIGGGGGKDPTSGTEDLGGKAEGGTAVEGSLREFL